VIEKLIVNVDLNENEKKEYDDQKDNITKIV